MRCIIGFTVVLISFSAVADQTTISNYRQTRDRYVCPKVYVFGDYTLNCNQIFDSCGGLQVEHVLPASWMNKASVRACDAN